MQMHRSVCARGVVRGDGRMRTYERDPAPLFDAIRSARTRIDEWYIILARKLPIETRETVGDSANQSEIAERLFRLIIYSGRDYNIRYTSIYFQCVQSIKFFIDALYLVTCIDVYAAVALLSKDSPIFFSSVCYFIILIYFLVQDVWWFFF